MCDIKKRRLQNLRRFFVQRDVDCEFSTLIVVETVAKSEISNFHIDSTYFIFILCFFFLTLRSLKILFLEIFYYRFSKQSLQQMFYRAQIRTFNQKLQILHRGHQWSIISSVILGQGVTSERRTGLFCLDTRGLLTGILGKKNSDQCQVNPISLQT